MYERRGWIAQKKKNGTCTVIFTNGEQVIFKTRRENEDHIMWSPQPAHIAFFQAAGGENGTWNVYVAELLHNKTKHIKNHLYIFDQIVSNGQQLVGVSLKDRLKLLERFASEERDDSFWIIPEVSITKCLTKDFAGVFDTLKDEDEGVVIKDPNAMLKACFKENTNGGWQVKSRKSTLNYGY